MIVHSDRYYVYTHSHRGKVFYVGMGKGGRAFDFSDLSRGKRWHRIVQSISGIKATTLKEFRTRDEALRFEMEQIELLKPEANTHGLRRFEDYKKLPGSGARMLGRPRKRAGISNL